MVSSKAWPVYETTASARGCIFTALSFTSASCNALQCTSNGIQLTSVNFSIQLTLSIKLLEWWPAKLDHFMRPQPPRGAVRVSFYSLSFHLWRDMKMKCHFSKHIKELHHHHPCIVHGYIVHGCIVHGCIVHGCILHRCIVHGCIVHGCIVLYAS